MKTLKKRRLQQKTDYKKRTDLLKGGSPRIVFRKTNRYIIAQYVSSKSAQDKVEIGVSSDALVAYGWPKEIKGSLKSTPASYLTGFLLGKKISEFKTKGKDPVPDMGMIRSIHKNRFFAFLKGLRDAGVKVKCDDENFPDEERVKGKHLQKDFSESFDKVKSSIEKEK